MKLPEGLCVVSACIAVRTGDTVLYLCLPVSTLLESANDITLNYSAARERAHHGFNEVQLRIQCMYSPVK
jgi:hypothetical protein